MKRFFILSMMLMVAVLMQAQLLYKISGNGMKEPSYIIGTHHFTQASFVDSIPGVQQALDETQQVYGELVMDDMMKPETLMRMAQAMMMPEGVTLSSLLTTDEATRLNAAMKELLGVDLNTPMVGAQLDRMMPTALSTQFTQSLYLKNHPAINGQDQFDSYFQNKAREQGKGVYGLETVDFQMEVLLTGQPLERQKELLMCMVDNLDFQLQMLEELTNAFRRQDLEAVGKALDVKLGNSCDSTPEETAKLIENRNANWIEQMPAIMQSKPTLFAVGAAHLVGDKGVLHLLRNAGYSVVGVR